MVILSTSSTKTIAFVLWMRQRIITKFDVVCGSNLLPVGLGFDAHIIRNDRSGNGMPIVSKMYIWVMRD